MKYRLRGDIEGYLGGSAWRKIVNHIILRVNVSKERLRENKRYYFSYSTRYQHLDSSSIK